MWESLWEEMSGSLQPSASLDSQDRKLGSQGWKSQLLLTPSVAAAFCSWVQTEQTAGRARTRPGREAVSLCLGMLGKGGGTTLRVSRLKLPDLKL